VQVLWSAASKNKDWQQKRCAKALNASSLQFFAMVIALLLIALIFCHNLRFIASLLPESPQLPKCYYKSQKQYLKQESNEAMIYIGNFKHSYNLVVPDRR
jgi:hypothetical protein